MDCREDLQLEVNGIHGRERAAARAPRPIGLEIRHPGALNVRCNADATFFYVTPTSNVTIVRNVKKQLIKKLELELLDMKFLESSFEPLRIWFENTYVKFR